VNLRDIEQAIADEKARIDAAHAAVAEAREALERAEKAQIEATLKAEARIVALEAAAQLFIETHEESPLHKSTPNASVNLRMETQKYSRPRGARPKTKHVGAARIRAVDGSVNAFAVKNGLRPTTVYGWCDSEHAPRKIPDAWAKKLRKPPYSIPLSAWTNGIDTDGE